MQNNKQAKIETQEDIERKCKARHLEHMIVNGQVRYIRPSKKFKLGHFQRYMEELKWCAENMTGVMLFLLCFFIFILGLPLALFIPNFIKFYIYIPIIFGSIYLAWFGVSCFIILFLYIKKEIKIYKENKKRRR